MRLTSRPRRTIARIAPLTVARIAPRNLNKFALGTRSAWVYWRSSACCGEGPGPNSPQPGIIGKGGGRIGALVISQWSQHHSFSSTPYNHYSLLASLEEIFRLPKLGYARTVSNRFGLDVYNTNWYTP